MFDTLGMRPAMIVFAARVLDVLCSFSVCCHKRRDLRQNNRCTLLDIAICHAITVRLWLTLPPSDIALATADRTHRPYFED